MNISYDYYKIFYYVAKHGSFTQAANRLLSNQPNVTRAMKALEAALGCTLFERTNKGATLTPEGEALYAHISLAFEHIQAGEEEIAQNRSIQKGIISIGATEISLRCYLLPILNEYRKKYPHIKIKISNLSTPEAIASLKNGLVDFAVVTSPIECRADITVKKVRTFKDIAVCGEAYQEAFASKRISLSELSNYPLISLGKGRSTYAFYADLFSQKNLSFSPDVEAATTDQILPLVKHNLGIGFVPEEFLMEAANGIFRLCLSEPVPSRTICAVTLKGRTPSLPAKALKEMLV